MLRPEYPPAEFTRDLVRIAVRIDPGLRRESQSLRFKAVIPGGAREVRWVLDDKDLSTAISPTWRLALAMRQSPQHPSRLTPSWAVSHWLTAA